MKKDTIYTILMFVLLLGSIPSINQYSGQLNKTQLSQLSNVLGPPNKEGTVIGENGLYDGQTHVPSSENSISDSIVRGTIEILNNSDFGPSKYNFPGTGTENNPYLIEGYSITDSSSTLIHIENTIVHFVIQECILDGVNEVHNGIFLHNVTHGTISNNIILNNHHSCYVYLSTNNTINNNEISYTSDWAINLDRSGKNRAIDNKIQNCYSGINAGPYSSSSQILRNNITDIASTGVYVRSDSSGSEVINNTLSTTGGSGVVISWYTDSVKIIGNSISDTSLASVWLASTNYGIGCIISNNTIMNSKEQGILFTGANSQSSITRNTIFNCTGHAIEFSADSDNNEIAWNNFFQNNGGGQQVLDRGIGNYFSQNYWDDWNNPDANSDGYTDMPYSVNPDRSSLYFDGIDDYGNLANFALNDISTIEFWVNVRDTTDGQGIIGKHTSGGGNLFMIYITSGTIRIEDQQGSLLLGPITTGWHHLAFVINQNATGYSYIAYQNGAHLINGSRNAIIGNNPTDKAWTIGQDWDGVASTSDFFNGFLNEIRFLNRSLTATEIYSDYISSINGPYPARSDTVAWYHIDSYDGYDILDSSGNGFEGSLISGAWRSYPVGFYFDGVNDYGNLGDFALNPSFSIELWVNPQDTTTSQCILGKHNNAGNVNIFLLFITGGNLFIYDSTNQAAPYNLGSISIGWQHIAVIVNEGPNVSYQCFRNGNFIGSYVSIGAVNLGPTDKPWTIGQDWDSATNTDFFKGSMSNIRFLNRSLSAQEIYEDYSYPNTYYPDRTETVAWYHLTEPTNPGGNVIADYSGNDYNGTTVNYSYATDAWKQGILNFDISPRVAPIWINDNDDFSAFSSSGNGSVDAPYILENYNLVSDSTTLLEIYNTTTFFIVQDSIFDGMQGGETLIILRNISNGIIRNNYIGNTHDNGIELDNTHHVNLLSNEVTSILGEGRDGINMISSHNNTIMYNTLSVEYTGIHMRSCFDNSFYGNLIKNSSSGIYLYQSDYNNMSWNKFLDNTRGVYFSSASDSSDNNQVQWNYFINNSYTPQAYDAGVNNDFSYNYWNDHTSPDTTPADGFVDTPYAINGGSNQDLYPRSVVGPIFTVISPLTQTYNVPKINISLMGNAYQYLYYIEGSDTQNHTWTNNITRTIPDGVYPIHIYGIDPVGYVTYKSVSFTIDFFKIASPLAQEYGSPPINISFTGYASHYWYYIEGIDSDNQTWTENMYRPLPAGSYTLHAYGNDTDGIIVHHSVNITVETTPPIINFINPLNATYFQNAIDLIYSIVDYDAYTFYFDGQDIPAYSGITIGFPGIEDEGRHNFTIVAIDKLKNIARSTVIFYIYIPPMLNIESPQAITYETETISISLTGDALYYWYYIDTIDSTNQTWTSDVTRNVPAGIYTLHAYGNTTSGAIAHKNVTFTVDIFTSTTTTLPTTTTEQSSSTTAKSGNFPSIFTVLLSLLPLVIIFRKRLKRT